MRRIVFLLFVSSLLLITGVFLIRLNNLPYNDLSVFLALSLLSFIAFVVAFFYRKRFFKIILTGVLSIILFILGSGILFKMMHWSHTVFWPVNCYFESRSPIKVTYKSYAWPEHKESGSVFRNKIPTEELLKKDYLYSFLVVWHDSLLFEHYYNGASDKSAFNIASCTKTFISAALGIAVDNKIIESEDLFLKDCMPEYYQNSTGTKKGRITLKHLLTMQAGWKSGRDNSKNLSGFNWIKSSMNNPLSYEPGTTFAYNNIEPHFILKIVEKESGLDGFEFLEVNLFTPLGIKLAHWAKTPQGDFFGGAGMYLTARDMARFGQLYLKYGKIDGKQIISEEWITKSTHNYISGDLKKENYAAKGYGYYWWIDNYNDFDVWQANGAAGQLIFIIPSLDLVIAATSKMNVSKEDAFKNSKELTELINSYIFLVKASGNYSTGI